MLAQGSGTLPQHVLVVDDQEDICLVVRLGLEELGRYRVSTACSGDRALPLLDADRPDLVVLDAILPGMTGIELAAHAVIRDIPVLVMTGEGGMDVRLERAGWPHLRKPFHLDQLVTQVRATLTEAQQNMLTIRESLRRLFETTGDLRDVLEHMAELRHQLEDTIERSRRLTDQ